MSDEQTTEQPERFQGPHQGNGATIKPPEETKPRAGALVPIVNGIFQPRTFQEIWDLCVIYVKSGMLPKQYDKPEKVVTALQYAAAVGLKDGLIALRQIAIINGSPSLYGDLPLAIVRGKGKLESISEYFIDRQGNRISAENKNLHVKPFGAICITKRKGDAYTVESSFTEDEAKQAGLFGKSGPWISYFKTMLKMRARSMNLKDSFPDDLNGISIAEYDHNLDEHTLAQNPIQDVTPNGTARAQSTGVNVGAIFAPTTQPVEDAVFTEQPKAEVTQPEAPEELAPIVDDVAQPEIEPFVVKKGKKKDPPLEDGTVTFGRHAGKLCSEVDGGELSATYFQLKSELKKLAVLAPTALVETVGVIEKFLAIKK